MTKATQTLFLSFIVVLSACAGREFVPLYKDVQEPAQTATLIAPIQIDLVYHNGEQKNLSPPYKPLVSYRLLPGKHLIGFRYQDIHLDENEDQEIITSKIVLIHFTAQAAKTYHINFDKPIDYFTAKQLEDVFQITLRQNNLLIASSRPAVEKLESDSFFSSEILPPLPTEEALPKNLAHESGQTPINTESAITHLKLWWGNASQKERDAFIHWVNLRSR